MFSSAWQCWEEGCLLPFLALLDHHLGEEACLSCPAKDHGGPVCMSPHGLLSWTLGQMQTNRVQALSSDDPGQ